MPVPPLCIRWMEPDEMATIKSWRKLDKEVDEFVFTRTRWKRWETDPPIVCIVDGELAGYHGCAFTKSGYINSASQFVHPDYRGRQLSGKMIGFMLKEGHKRGMTRLRFRTPHEGPGLDVWTGLGAQPFGRCPKNYWFDLCIEGIGSLKDFIHKAPILHFEATNDNRTLSHYRRNGVEAMIMQYIFRLNPVGGSKEDELINDEGL
jgi:GNAT superfamily N-acetyltransferase